MFTENKKTPYLVFTLITLLILIVCISLGSVRIPFTDIITSIKYIFSDSGNRSSYETIIFQLRIPRALGALLVGASLSLAGAVMQGVLKNPLADGSTLGVSSAASLGAGIAIVTGFNIANIPFSGIFILAIVFAIASLCLIIFLAYKIDKTVSNNTIILLGIIFSMLSASGLNLLMIVFREDIQNIFFWTMGSLAATSYTDIIILTLSLLIFARLAFRNVEELNAFSLGENQARNIGVDVKNVKRILLIASSILVGVSVAVAGNISFVGIIIPHISRLIVGPNYKKLLPLSLFIGGSFLMIADLLSRTLFSPVELPIGAITSAVGSLIFIIIFVKGKK